MLKPVDTMERITRQYLADNFDEILEKVNKEDVGYVILDNEGRDGQVLCPAIWLEYTDGNIHSIMDTLKAKKEELYKLVEVTIKRIENGEISDIEGIEDFKFMLMDYGDDCRFFELYRSLTDMLKEKYPQFVTGKWE